MPAKAGAYRAEQLSQVAGLTHQLGTSAEVGDWIKSCEDQLPPCADEAETALRAANVREWRRDYDRATKLPARLVEDVARTTLAGARDLGAGAARLEFRRLRAVAGKDPRPHPRAGRVLGYTTCAYDALLEGYEPGARAAELVPVFADLQKQLTPLLPALQKNHRSRRSRAAGGKLSHRGAAGAEPAGGRGDGLRLRGGPHRYDHAPLLHRDGPEGLPPDHALQRKGFQQLALRTMHEAGHGLYTQGLDAAYFGTPMGTYVSLGIHESQSRLWENQVGRSREFWAPVVPARDRDFPRSGRAGRWTNSGLLINRVKPSHIRVEADEATYNLHIILRFEIEQKLISGDLAVADLPQAWNARFEELFQIPCPTTRAVACRIRTGPSA